MPHSIVKKKKKKQHLHKIKNKITSIFQLLLSIIKKVRNNRRKSNESGDLDRIFGIVDKSVGKKWAKAL
ncbi:hypothetical protein Q7455_07900 [Glaesserella parasuis]|nr:hypothetical protein [Glaesserella parasuis]MDO9785462.1 hypothetical protein [Glaesserella parasuis]MDO9869574.1 hypothetical protein [Glaesserella parasuis]MDO9891876.1 hypothetical protein [Glaesserella parasuis]MDO9911509.1 hypothetical protein [Glaesserella parasuis]